jgi:hypothetical protein
MTEVEEKGCWSGGSSRFSVFTLDKVGFEACHLAEQPVGEGTLHLSLPMLEAHSLRSAPNRKLGKDFLQLLFGEFVRVYYLVAYH